MGARISELNLRAYYSCGDVMAYYVLFFLVHKLPGFVIAGFTAEWFLWQGLARKDNFHKIPGFIFLAYRKQKLFLSSNVVDF
jgi:hypothetical protein